VTTTRPTEVIPIQMANRCTDAEARRRGLMFSALMPSKAVLPGSQAVLHCITPGHGIVPNNKGHIIPDGKPLLSVCLSPAGSTPYFSYEDQYPRNDPLCQASPEEQGFFCEYTPVILLVCNIIKIRCHRCTTKSLEHLIASSHNSSDWAVGGFSINMGVFTKDCRATAGNACYLAVHGWWIKDAACPTFPGMNWWWLKIKRSIYLYQKIVFHFPNMGQWCTRSSKLVGECVWF